jgi:Protein of unknown function (DUF550)
MKIKDIQTLQYEQGRWAQGNFPTQTVVSKIKHLRREVDELLANPHDRSEMADCFLLLLDIASRQNMTVAQLVEIAAQKLEINRRRQWGRPDAEGVCEHIREEVAKAE